MPRLFSHVLSRSAAAAGAAVLSVTALLAGVPAAVSASASEEPPTVQADRALGTPDDPSAQDWATREPTPDEAVLTAAESLSAPPAEVVAATADGSGPLRVVTVKENGGEPEVDVSGPVGTSAAEALVAQAQDDPSVLAIGVDHRVSVALADGENMPTPDSTPSPTVTPVDPAPAAEPSPTATAEPSPSASPSPSTSPDSSASPTSSSSPDPSPSPSDEASASPSASPSPSESAVVVAGSPSEATNVVATAGDHTIEVEWEPPISTGGAPIEHYAVLATLKDGEWGTGSWRSSSACTPTGDVLACDLRNLANGRVYEVRVQAVNGRGYVSWSETQDVTPFGPPDRLAAPNVYPMDEGVWVTMNFGNEFTWDGLPFRSFDVTLNTGQTCSGPSNADGVLRSCLITGLTVGESYTATSTLTNDNGTSLVSPASEPLVLPATPFLGPEYQAPEATAWREGLNSHRGNDPLRAQQETGYDYYGLNSWQYVEYPWFYGRGEGVTVAVIDTGVDGLHPDLAGQVLPGIDLVTPDPASLDVPEGWNADHPHGTHVAGIIAAKDNNGVGITGLAPDARILPVKVLGSDGTGWMSTVAQGIIDATDAGAHVLNLSLGSYEGDPVLEAAVTYATSRGVAVVAAGGNSPNPGIRYYNAENYPASYEETFAVAAAKSGCSGLGGDYMDVSAPGCQILSTIPGDGYARYSGSSMATPQIAAAFADLISAGASVPQAEDAIRKAGVLYTTETRTGVYFRFTTPSSSYPTYDSIRYLDPFMTHQFYGSGASVVGRAMALYQGIATYGSNDYYGYVQDSPISGGGTGSGSDPAPGDDSGSGSDAGAPGGSSSGGSGSTGTPSSGGSSVAGPSGSAGSGGGSMHDITEVRPAFGPLSGGNQVSLIGFGFTGARKVLIGGVSVPFTVVNDAHISLTVPKGKTLGSADVLVLLPPDVGQILAPGGYVYVADAAPAAGPAVDSISPSESATTASTSMAELNLAPVRMRSTKGGASRAVFAVGTEFSSGKGLLKKGATVVSRAKVQPNGRVVFVSKAVRPGQYELVLRDGKTPVARADVRIWR